MERISQSLQRLQSKLLIDRFEQLRAVIAVIQHGCKIEIGKTSYAAALTVVLGTIHEGDEMPDDFKRHYGFEKHQSSKELLTQELERFLPLVEKLDLLSVVDKAVSYTKENTKP